MQRDLSACRETLLPSILRDKLGEARLYPESAIEALINAEIEITTSAFAFMHLYIVHMYVFLLWVLIMLGKIQSHSRHPLSPQASPHDGSYHLTGEGI